MSARIPTTEELLGRAYTESVRHNALVDRVVEALEATRDAYAAMPYPLLLEPKAVVRDLDDILRILTERPPTASSVEVPDA